MGQLSLDFQSHKFPHKEPSTPFLRVDLQRQATAFRNKWMRSRQS